jgi:hypothetical protein
LSSPRFKFYEVVRVSSGDPELDEINGEVGAILGRAELPGGGFEYGVFVYRDEICWTVAEADLVTTGVVKSRESFYDGSSIRVRVDVKGKGWVVKC